MPSFGMGRVLLATAIACGVGSFYYWSKLEPILEILARNEFEFPLNEALSYALVPPFVGAFCWLILSICVNQYVNKKQIATSRLFTMSFELWLMSVCLSLPNVRQYDDRKNLEDFASDQLFNLILILSISFVLGYKRCPAETSGDKNVDGQQQNGHQYMTTVKNGTS
uniref:Uncharacterized protein n=1 Tax=Romanomermis culicivorax TaxID=13658 RepID=A0A915JSS8_ROMCU